MPPATLQLARTFSALSWAEIPAPVRHETERLLLDTLGCLLAGVDTEIGPIARKVGLTLGGGIPVFVAGGADLGLLGAIYANARLANALDLDETFPVGAHFGVGAVASALGLAEAQKQSGAAFLTAILTGYELGARLASQIGPVIEITDGRVTGFPVIWGVAAPVVLAAAGAAARLLAQDPDTFAQTLGVAGANTPIPAGAHWAAAVDLPNAKYCDAGWCAVTGAGAALAVEAGTTGFPTILDGPSGLARVSGAVSSGVAHLTEGLGERWLIADITYKPWPSCRFTHPVLTALGAILANERPAVDAITAIVVETGPLNGSARFTLATPRTFASRQFSFPHLVAMQLLAVPPGPDWSDPRWVEDPVATALRAKVSFVSHPRGEDFVHSLTRNQMRTLPGGIQSTSPTDVSCGPRAILRKATPGTRGPFCRTRCSPQRSVVSSRPGRAFDRSGGGSLSRALGRAADRCPQGRRREAVSMRSSLSHLSGLTVDVLVIGAGINGASAAQHLAAAGHDVLLVDKADFGAGATARSSRLLHCGLRYLAPGRSITEFLVRPDRLLTALRMARQAMAARAELVRTVPERVTAMRFCFPVYRDGPYRPWQIDAAFGILAGLGSGGRIPLDYERLSAEVALARPLLRALRDPDRLEAVACFREYQIDWPERLCLDAVLDAERCGARVRNYTSAALLGSCPEGWQVRLVDTLGSEPPVHVTARRVLNLAGTGIDAVTRTVAPDARRRVVGTKGAHLLVRLPPDCAGTGIAALSRRGEPFYCIPWRGLHFFGPTETLYDGDPHDVRV